MQRVQTSGLNPSLSACAMTWLNDSRICAFCEWSTPSMKNFACQTERTFVDLADDHVEAPVSRPGIEHLRALVAESDDLRDEALEGRASPLVAAGADELLEADHARRLTDLGDAPSKAAVRV